MKSQLKQEFGRRLKAARKARDLTQSRLAELMKVESVTVSRWETGVHIPSEAQVAVLQNILNSGQELFDLIQPQVPSLTVTELTRVIERQEHRIQTLETQLAAHRVHKNAARTEESSNPARAETPSNLGGDIESILPKLNKETALSVTEMLAAIRDLIETDLTSKPRKPTEKRRE